MHPWLLGRVGWWAALFSAVLTLCPSQAWAVAPCEFALASPVSGETVRRFSPADRGGHWGVDLASSRAGAVRSPVSGTVTFAGRVAGRLSVTIAPRDRVRVSVSYLSRVRVAAGQWVEAGEVLGRSGTDHGLSAVHLSLRVGGRYADPAPALACGRVTMHRWGRLRLVTDPTGSGTTEEAGTSRWSRSGERLR